MPPLRTTNTSLARRAMLALLLTIGFYLLAFVIMGLLGLVAVADIASQRPHIQILLISVIGFLAILFAIIPRADKFETPWPRLTPEQHPLLFAKLESIAAAANQRMPDEVYLLPDLNAWVMDRGRGGRRRVMGIGLPLIHLLDVSEFTAVIAHEFGHYYGGDTRLGPWIHKTHATIGRTLQNLGESSAGIVQVPFLAYGRMFLRVSMSVSREQEYTADRFAASITDPEAVATSLKRLAGYSPGVAMYWNHLLLPTLGSGYRPSIVEGMTRLFSSKTIADAARHLTDRVIQEPPEHPFDTHPSLRDRIAALEGLPRGSTGDTNSALTLLGDLRPVEDQIVNMYLPGEKVANLKPIAWDEVGERVFVAGWTRLREVNRALLASWTVDEMGAVFYPGNHLAAEVRNAEGKYVDPEMQAPLLYALIRGCVSLALCDAGWTFIARPDQGISFVRGEEHLSVEYLLNAVVQAQVPQESWADACRKAGIAGMLLSGGMSPTGPGTRWTPVLRTIQTGLRYEGGNGASIDVPIIIRGAKDESEVTAAQQNRLREWYGVEGTDWTLLSRAQQEHKGHRIDVVEIVLKNGRKRSLYFDCTERYRRLGVE